ncbi:MAG: hypothetical protein HYV09_31670 [Deltaproteobacteria bacterium]|nr:hypothetical protein [Deltaproteobacteria bacterium]
MPSRSLFARAARAGALLSFSLFAFSLTRCAESECKYNSDCAAGRCVAGKCERECFAAVDCPKDRPACVSGWCEASGDGGVDAPAVDSGKPDSTPIDSGSIDSSIGDSTAPDTYVPADTAEPDTFVPDTASPDVSTGTKGYLTKCASNDECASGVCSPSAPRFCTKACSSHGDCAHGQICGGGLCRLDDTGYSACDTSTASPCLEYCFGTATAKHCTHSCSSAAECPAGYACMPAGGGKKVCVDIERPCSAPEQCPSALGFCGAGGVGCTAKCDTDADCPLRLVGLPAYRCEFSGSIKVCMPPSDILGSDPLGSTCPSTGVNYCRSGACDDGTSPPTCAQRCTVRGGCAGSFGCFPLEDPGPPKTALLVCSAAGSAWLGDACTRGRDCRTAICQAPGYCTRLCVDNLCPDGMSCVAAPLSATDGTPIKLCTKF